MTYCAVKINNFVLVPQLHTLIRYDSVVIQSNYKIHICLTRDCNGISL